MEVNRITYNEIANNVSDENKRKEMIDYVGKIDGTIYRFCNHFNDKR